jgi:hypothetical protein
VPIIAKILGYLMSNSPQKNERLMIRQKDYELLSIKRINNFQVSTQDPLINPPKKKATKKAPLGIVSAVKK